MFENLMKQVRAVTTITGHMGGQVGSMHGQLMVGALSSPVLGAQILLGDVSRILDALEYIPDTEEFDFGVEVGGVYENEARNRDFLLHQADQLREEMAWIEDVISELTEAITLVQYELGKLSHMMQQLSNLSADQKETDGIARAAEAVKELVVPELYKLDLALARILDVYKDELRRRQDHVWFLEISHKWVLRLRRDIKARRQAKARKEAEEEEKRRKEEGEQGPQPEPDVLQEAAAEGSEVSGQDELVSDEKKSS
jgi:hypothetical protein